jgi:hypothetical protein
VWRRSYKRILGNSGIRAEKQGDAAEICKEILDIRRDLAKRLVSERAVPIRSTTDRKITAALLDRRWTTRPHRENRAASHSNK